ncbi:MULTISPECIES: DUF5980 family protein [Streptomyces]|uniref:DUF5980 family protein n=1 Tax=Streptomyces edwardsiae TaxID=3075527 RepID=A0ABU2PT04_9ACTN|nr:DUF5980 family protein [Streptomyces sp. DSM 41636]MDT0394415.1 DUF5980 family protein [Streptomyces sp. DSM 41636]
MKARQRAAGLVLGLSSTLALGLTGASPASASATWTLEAEGQRICVEAGYGWPNTYAFAPVSGTWSAPIRTGVRGLPPGSTSQGGSTIAPGTNERDPVDHGLVVNGWLQLSIAAAQAGEYTAEIWATDGTETQTDSLLIVFKDECY